MHRSFGLKDRVARLIFNARRVDILIPSAKNSPSASKVSGRSCTDMINTSGTCEVPLWTGGRARSSCENFQAGLNTCFACLRSSCSSKKAKLQPYLRPESSCRGFTGRALLLSSTISALVSILLC